MSATPPTSDATAQTTGGVALEASTGLAGAVVAEIRAQQIVDVSVVDFGARLSLNDRDANWATYVAVTPRLDSDTDPTPVRPSGASNGGAAAVTYVLADGLSMPGRVPQYGFDVALVLNVHMLDTTAPQGDGGHGNASAQVLQRSTHRILRDVLFSATHTVVVGGVCNVPALCAHIAQRYPQWKYQREISVTAEDARGDDAGAVLVFRRATPVIQIPGGLSVVLNAYRRDYFYEQLAGVFSQTRTPTRVYVWQNTRTVDMEPYKDYYPICVVRADENFKFFGRFSLALLMQTEWVSVLDDDYTPTANWFEKCHALSSAKNCIVGANGRWLNRDQTGFRGIGDNARCATTQVQFVGHIWFFRKVWVHYMFREPPVTYDNAEDIHFACSAKLHGNIDCYTLGQDGVTTSHCRYSHGTDAHASYRLLCNHGPLRVRVMKHFIARGFGV